MIGGVSEFEQASDSDVTSPRPEKPDGWLRLANHNVLSLLESPSRKRHSGPLPLL